MARRSGWPIPAMVFLATLGAALALLVRDGLPPFSYALLALSSGGLLLVFPLLSDLGALLRHDEGGDWVGALPALAVERALARALHVVVLLAGLVLAWFAPWALLAPVALGPFERASLVVLGLMQALLLATVLIWAQQILLARLELFFVLLESVLIAGVVVALVQLLGHLPELAALDPRRPGLDWFPSVWFARPLSGGSGAWSIPLCSTVLSAGALLAVPAGRSESSHRRNRSERWLEPLYRIAVRSWVRPAERGAFDLVYLALPREREVALRTYPLLGIPLAFLWIAAGSARDAGEAWRADLLALLLFTAGVYLPVLLTHVPLTESPAASWILRMSPGPVRDVSAGAIKALFVRYLLPLYGALLVLGLALAQAELILRLWLPAVLLALLLLRLMYPRCVRDLPLSVGPDALRSELDWAGLVAPLAVGLTLVAVAANRFLDWKGGLGLALLLLSIELVLERSPGRPHPRTGGPGVAGAGVIPPSADD